ncbi:TetR/AcrR family transcriptional regulator [Rhizobium sp. GN54]|uniref:TetR/AcrR family transcriptional regulator n=1 Tax=Rhizobium sp. GN54 TaxID=2898150 RepID=UPI001E5540A4|nr:TetR/AcrR family transcriptional regulator [Rhizobium sp. GN54]MCD2183821.1 TetR/AcrR family transcriptional regulator [Rhizobium sp. GN54]
MTGLRARQKADKNRRILEAATGLFHEVGYDAARIEDIAERAAVSVGTFYNYYQSKGDMLLATVAMEVEEVLESGRSIVGDPPRDVLSAVSLLVDQYYDHSLVYLSKEMWRTAMAISIQQPETPFSKRYTDLDRALCAQVSTLVGNLQRKGAVRAEIDTGAVGAMFFNNLNMMFTDFVRDEAMTLDRLKHEVARQNGPLATLISVTAT